MFVYTYIFLFRNRYIYTHMYIYIYIHIVIYVYNVKRKKQLAQIIKTRSTAYIYTNVLCTPIRSTCIMRFSDLDFSGSPGVHPTPGLTSSTQVVCVCARAYTSKHTPTTLTPAKTEKYTRQTPYLYPCQNIASHTSNKC